MTLPIPVGRNLYVDRLRGIASLTVVVSHLSGGYIPSMLTGLPLAIRESVIGNSVNAVSLFFVISGFLITQKILAAQRRDSFSLATFYTQRVGRIMPPLALMIVVASILAMTGIERTGVDWGDFGRTLMRVFTFNYNLELNDLISAMRNGHPSKSENWRLMSPLWSLSIEEVFYLCFPLMMLLVKPKRTLVVILICIVIIGPVQRYRTGSFYLYFNNFDSIATGCLAAILAQLRPGYSRPLMFAGIAILAATFIATRDQLPALVWGASCINLGAFTYLVGVAHKSTRSSPASFLLEKFGVLSYEVYLFHMLLITALAPVFSQIAAVPQAWQGTISYLGLFWFLGMLLWISQTISNAYSVPADNLIRSASRQRAGRPGLPL